MGEIIKAEQITKNYGNLKVLKGVSLVVNEGDFLSILGQSGSGKTTFLTILGGMERPTDGVVNYLGTDLTKLDETKLAKLRRTEMGFVFQFFNLSPYLTLKENIFLPITLDGKSKKDYINRYEELVEKLNIKEIENKFPSETSGGEQQRCAIVRALIYSPKIIFLDEPTGNLDSENTKEIMELIKRINVEYKTTIIQVTHNDQNAEYGNKIVRFKDGLITEIKEI
ncbi:MAG: ABC transporter ATP-binding protein [Clostridia bacterium]|nr:ABC transporter ATP-binding protein [Clostridia bacterium]